MEEVRRPHGGLTAASQWEDAMRILHFSDLHIGVENYGRIDPETGLSTRLGDFLYSLDQVVEFALNESVDLVLLAGDAYKGRDPTQTHQREFAKRLNRLSRAGIPTFLLVGNHDLPAASSRATGPRSASAARLCEVSNFAPATPCHRPGDLCARTAERSWVDPA